MAKVDPIPNEETLSKRRKPKFIIDPKDVEVKDDLRIRQWALGIMKKMDRESRLDSSVPNKRIVYEKEIEAEDIDIKNIYPFEDLWYMVFRFGKYWKLRLIHKRPAGNYAILAEMTYADIK